MPDTMTPADPDGRSTERDVDVPRARGAWRRSRAWRVIRIVWVSLGVLVMAYMALSFSAWGVGDEVLASDDVVRVVEGDGLIAFTPVDDAGGARLLFLPGGIVDPHAYAPLLRAVAEAGHPVTLVRLPFLGRHAPSESAKRETVARAIAVMNESSGERPWVVAGHSMGGHLAARVARRGTDGIGGLVLLGTTHPRDFSLADLTVPVVKVYGTNDGIAPLHRMRENAAMLPESTAWIAIDGGNHSQFGYYGFQLGDHRAAIGREEQQAQLLAALLSALRGASAPADVDSEDSVDHGDEVK